MEIARATKKGKQPRFTRQPKGMFGLSRWSTSKVERQIDAHNEAVKAQMRRRLADMPWSDFEKLVGHLLAQFGFADIKVTSKGGDGGIDVRGTMVVADVVRTRMAVQVKRWKHNVQAPTIHMVRGALGAHDQGLIITTCDFGSGTRREASRTTAVPVALMNGDQLVDLMVEHQLGAKRPVRPAGAGTRVRSLRSVRQPLRCSAARLRGHLALGPIGRGDLHLPDEHRRPQRRDVLTSPLSCAW